MILLLKALLLIDELIKKLKFDETAKSSDTFHACQYYHPQAFKEPW